MVTLVKLKCQYFKSNIWLVDEQLVNQKILNPIQNVDFTNLENYDFLSCIILRSLKNCLPIMLEHFAVYPPFTRKEIASLYFGGDVRTILEVAISEVSWPPVFHIIKVGRRVKCLAQGHNKRTCRLVLHNIP